MEQYNIKKIGVFRTDDAGSRIILDPAYKAALEGLSGFGHLQVLWWFSHCDNAASRGTTQEASPYRHSPAVLGTFATRSPQRPNPIALSCVQVLHVDVDSAAIWIAWADADDGSPVLDIKPYTPALDRVETPTVPQWCGHWPESMEASDGFDWASEFCF